MGFEEPRPAGAVPPEYQDALRQDRGLDTSLRPRSLAEFVGQRDVVANLGLAIRAARGRGEPIDHVLLSGLPGLGKTTLAHVVARESDATLHEAPAPTLQRAGDLAGVLTRLERGDVLFIDEIHRLPAGVEEYLYAAMEDFVLDIMIDQGTAARSVRVDLPRFTLVGATTREGLLTAPLRARFGIHERLDLYESEFLQQIVRRSAGLLGIAIEDAAARLLADRARGTPRVVNRFLKRVRDLAEVEGEGRITEAVAEDGLARLGVDAFGLTRMDRMILASIARGGGAAIGLKTLCAAVGEDERTVEDVYEPHLLRSGLLLKTPQGRRLTPRGLALSGVEPVSENGSLPFR
jgi:Holliday junction DNA helicase RuvB